MISPRGALTRGYNGINKLVARALIPTFNTFKSSIHPLETFGAGDGSWVVPANAIGPNSTCYCVGVGMDISFDMDLAARGANVFSFDPTPRSIEYMSKLNYDRQRITFVPVGIWNETTELKFYAPMNRKHANYSSKDIHGTASYFTAKCKKLREVMNEFGHKRLDLLKLDIEGSWYEVLADIVDSEIDISVLCVEFDSPTSLVRTSKIIQSLKKIELELVHQQRDNFLFLKSGLFRD